MNFLVHINALERQIQDLKDDLNAEKRARQMAEEILATERLIWKRREEELRVFQNIEGHDDV